MRQSANAVNQPVGRYNPSDAVIKKLTWRCFAHRRKCLDETANDKEHVDAGRAELNIGGIRSIAM
jgi:hypothetical protein